MTGGGAATIGVVTGWLEPVYHVPVLRGVRFTARELGYNVVTVMTTVPGAGAPCRPEPYLDPASIGGLIVFGSSGWSPSAGASSERARPWPLCTIATELPEASSVTIDNATGMRAIVRHLVEHHGHRRFAFVGGPEVYPDARARLDAFRRALHEHHLSIEERCILPGDFLPTGGAHAVRTLFGTHGVATDAIDAIVAANDGMARGVIDELAARGIRVPWQLAVVGFDDGLIAPHAPVPLTTVHQPLHALGQRAVRLLVARMRQDPPEHAMLPAELVVRRSCGCLEGMGRLQLSAADLQRRGGRGFEIALHERRSAILTELRQATRERVLGLASGWEARLLTALLEELKGRSPDAFRVELQSVLDQVVEQRGAPSAFHEVVSILWRHVVPCTLAEPALRTVAEGTLDGARLAVCSASSRLQASEFEATLLLAEHVGEIGVMLGAATSLTEVASIARDHFPRLGIQRLVLATQPPASDGVEQILRLHDGRVDVAARRLHPAALASTVLTPGSRGEVVIMPLHAHGRHDGALCMTIRPLRPVVLHTLRDGLSAVLHRVGLLGGG